MTQDILCIHTTKEMRSNAILPHVLRDRRIKRVGLQAGGVGGQTPDKVDVALARLVQLGVFTQTLVVDG